MYQYKYIPVDTGGGFLSDTREHRELIDAYAAEGWRYVGFFPVSFTSHGGIKVWTRSLNGSRKLPT